MADTVECIVCMEDFHEDDIVKCSACEICICRVCTKRYLLGSTQQAHCMGCKRVWSMKFLLDNFRKGWITGMGKGAYRTHYKEIFLEKEKAKIPDTLMRVPQFLEQEKRVKISREIMAERKKMKTRYKNMYSEMDKIKWSRKFRDLRSDRDMWDGESKSLYHKIRKLKSEKAKVSKKRDRDFAREQIKILDKKIGEYKIKSGLEDLIKGREDLKERIEEQGKLLLDLRGMGGKKEEPKIRFICPCPIDECRGMIESKTFKCCVCEEKVCKSCRASLKDLKKKHRCKKDDLESIKFIRKDTKPCPQCAAYIHKTGGCEQMWCGQCKVVFSWTTGKMETGIVHNPHAIEWRRQHGGMQRDIGDVPCGGLVDFNWLERYLPNNIYNKTRVNMFKIYRCVADTRYKLEVNTLNEDFDKHRLQYVLGRLSEDKWKQRIFLMHRSNDRKQANTDILNTFRTIAVEQFRNLYETCREIWPSGKGRKPARKLKEARFDFLKSIEELRVFINETFKTELAPLGGRMPYQIDTDWEWSR